MLGRIRRLGAAGATLLLSGCFTVDSYVDAPDANPGDGTCADSANRCTLRAAIMEANTRAFKTTIFVPAGTYELDLPLASGGGALTVAGSMKIQGSGAATTVIEQTVPDGVLRVESGTDVEINLVTVQGGDTEAGGGIWIEDGTVELEDLVVRDNFGFTGGGGLLVEVGAVVRVRRSTIANNDATGAFGGGIWNYGDLRVYDSTISGNDSNRAGGIRNSGNLILRNVTVSGNTAHSTQAGVGGISQNGFAVLNNVTVTGNVGVGNDLASFRGGGIQTSAGALTVMKNSIVAGNDGGFGPDDCVGELTPDSKYNLIGDTSQCTITSFLSTYWLGVDADLGPLADHGGPTFTHLPGLGSLARDGAYEFPPPAVDACELHDQRGVPRPQGAGTCDLGAVEYTNANAFVTGFMLVNAATDADIRPLNNDDVVILPLLPPSLSVRAVVSGGVGSVVFGYDGDPSYRTENFAPYSLGGDGSGDYAPVTLAGGTHVLTAQPYAAAEGAGAAGGSLQIEFTVLTD